MATIRKGLFGVLLALFAGTTTSVSADAPCLKMVSAFQGGDHVILPSLQSALTRHGLCFHVSYVPGNRATVLMREGQIDGELFRVSEYQQELGTVGIRVPTAIFEAHGLLVTLSPSLLALEKMKGKPVAVLRGTLWQQRVLPQHAISVEIDDYKAAFSMLETNRVDGVLIDSLSLIQISKRPANLHTRRVTPKTAAFVYLHHRHKDLVPALDRALQDWKAGFQAKPDAADGAL